MSFRSGTTGICPHCETGVRFEPTDVKARGSNYGTADPLDISTYSDFSIRIQTSGCPVCGKPIVLGERTSDPRSVVDRIEILFWPESADRPVPDEVETRAPELASDFREAVAVFPRSKKASAALSRRCLQYILTTEGGAKSRTLAAQIEEVLDALPTQIALNVDAVRQVGNFAAHPMKSTASGEIVPVEEGEAEWILDVIEELFEYYYVAPAQAAARRATLNKKLEDLGKPSLKEPNVPEIEAED